VSILDKGGRSVGGFRAKGVAFGDFSILDSNGHEVASVNRDWKQWNIRFLDTSGNEIGTVTRSPSSLRDVFTISLREEPTSELFLLLFGAGLAMWT
jgi:hypothetical protein